MNPDFRDLGVPGYVILKIKAEDTENNQKIFSAFRELAQSECRNDYTLTLRKLLEYYEADAKFEQLWYVIHELEERIATLEAEKTKPIKKEKGVFE